MQDFGITHFSFVCCLLFIIFYYFYSSLSVRPHNNPLFALYTHRDFMFYLIIQSAQLMGDRNEIILNMV